MLAVGRCVKPVLWLQTRSVSLVAQAGYAKKAGKSCRESWQEMGLITEEDPYGFQALDAAKAIEDWVDFDGKQHVKDLIREEERRQKIVRFKTIERKYFKPKQEVNLLSWDAKEQMRFLHQEYPEEWTIDRLAESFPISRKGVAKILRSKFVPKTVDEIIKHDERVKRNWKALTAGERESDGPIASRYKQLLNDGKVWSLEHAAGIRSLPMPDKSRYLPTVNLNRYNPTAKPGPFESMVKDYCERTGAKQTRELKNEEILEQNEMENLKLLQSVTSAKLLKSGNMPNKTPPSLEKENCVNYKKAFTQADPALDPAITQAPVPKTNLHLQSLLDHVEGVSPVNVETLHRRGRGEGRGWSSSSRLPADTDAGMCNTRKINSSHLVSATENGVEVEHEQRSSKQYSVTPEQAKVWSQIKYEEKPGGSGEDIPYMYDRQAGYQYPLGRKAQVVDKIEVPKQNSSSSAVGAVYQKGKDFYDEDGEFLFRIA